jgi:hypothetical protein
VSHFTKRMRPPVTSRESKWQYPEFVHQIVVAGFSRFQQFSIQISPFSKVSHSDIYIYYLTYFIR